MGQIPGYFIFAIILLSFAIILRAIKLSAAMFLVGVVAVAFTLLPWTGKYAKYIPSWIFWGIVIVIGINLVRSFIGILFGKNVADGFTGSLVSNIFTPLFRIVEIFFKTIFRSK